MILEMKAVVITREGDPSVLELRDVKDPLPGPTELLVRTKATSLNRADLLQRRGKYPAPKSTRQDIPGLEFAGIVEWSGPLVKSYGKGDRVMGLLPGEGHAELVKTPASLALPIPENLTFEEAAAIPEAFLTAHDALTFQLDLKAKEGLLIHAVGSGVGTAALQLATVVGALTFGSSTSQSKLERAVQMGLSHAIDTGSSFFDAYIEKATEGRGVEAILDLVGASYWAANLRCLAPRGRMVLVGLVGGSRAQIDLGPILSKRLKLIGTVLRSRSEEEKTELTRSFQEWRLPLFETGSLSPVVDRIFPLEEIVQAHTYMEENRNFGKIVLTL
jgi:putative PIG3 family NAD(P)H quinone oxidoreductase